jgi:hypothetical protein
VSAGSLLVRQSTPVSDAERTLAVANRELTALQQALEVDVREQAVKQAELRTYSAAEVATLRVSANTDRVQEASEALVTSLEQGIVQGTEAVDFISNNRPLFTAEGMELYHDAVVQLYGTVPDQFRGGLAAPVTDIVGLKEQLAELQTQGSGPVALQAVSAQVREFLETLLAAFDTAEKAVFDRRAGDESTQAAYELERTALLRTRQSLESAESVVKAQVDVVLQDAVAQDTNVDVTELDRATAKTYANTAQEIAARSDAVAKADEAVVAAKQSLGQITAPFTASVSQCSGGGGVCTAGHPALNLSR